MIAFSYPELLANLKAMIDAAPIDCGHKLPEWRALAEGEITTPELYDIKTRAPMVAVHGPMRPHSLRVDVRYQIDGARGCYTVSHHQAALQRLADKVAKIPGAFGYKRPRAAAPRAANVTRWSTAALSVWRQSLECAQFEDAARLGLEKLGARFMRNDGKPLMFVAPAPIEGQPARVVTARRCDGRWVALDWLSLRMVSKHGHGSRSAAADDAQTRIAEAGADKLAAVMCRLDPEPQAAARVAWLEARGLDNADVQAAGPDVPEWLAGFQGSIVAKPEPVATEAAPAPEPEPAPMPEPMPAPVAGLYGDGSPDPRNSAPLPELDSYRPGDAVDVPGRTIGACTVLALFTRALAGFPDPSRIARVINPEGKRLDVLTSELAPRAAPASTLAPAAQPAAHPRMADALAILAAAVAPAVPPAVTADPPPPPVAAVQAAPAEANAAAVAELVASHGQTEDGAAALERLATQDSAYAASQPWDAFRRAAYAAQRAADCRAAAAEIRAALQAAAEPAPIPRDTIRAMDAARAHAGRIDSIASGARAVRMLRNESARITGAAVGMPAQISAEYRTTAEMLASLADSRAEALAPEPPAPSPRRILAAFLPGLAMRSAGPGRRMAGRALPAAHHSGPAGLILARLRPGGADALHPGVVESVHSAGAAGPGLARLPQFARGAPPPGVVAFEIQPGKPERPALPGSPHRHTAWLRQPAGEWRRFAPGVAGAAALAGVHGVSLRRSILALTAVQPAMPHAGAAGALAARGRPVWRAAHPPPVMAAVHHLQAAGPMLARSRPLVAGAGPPGVAEMPVHPPPPVWR